ncbi:MAG: exodeoxyribonuclease VII large subunit [Candidatus Omnitrophica bacterium]|nr:exodeoxyribonuclease VII large subunit [Candidatus Omnitrophota bacterium]
MNNTIHIATVTELTRSIRFLLEETFQTVWVRGEVSNFIRHSSGHMYFSLKDETSVLPAVLFKNVNKDLPFELSDGLQVICRGRIGVYEKRGAYQLYVDAVEPEGRGALQLAFEQLKEKLRKEGLFDAARKRPLPFLPKAIGVVTSPTGAAVRDIINVAERRFPTIEIIVNPVKVQGDGAKEEIAEAIKLFNRLGTVDVLIVGRGGGSLEDLWPFNEEIVARAIYGSVIPVVSAVGHEVDWTIADFVADVRAPTPSAAAEIVVPRKEDLKGKIADLSERLQKALFNIADQHTQRIDEIIEELVEGAVRAVRGKEEDFMRQIGRLEALSPLGVLKRGYSITERAKDGRVVRSVADIKKGECVKTILAEGNMVSRVEEVRE